MRISLLFPAVLLATTGTAHAGEMIGDAAAGQNYAREVCAECHHVETYEPTVIYTDIRAFTAIAEDPRTTELSLRVFLQTPHNFMPDLILTAQQTDDVIAYILSLRAPVN